MSRKFKGNLIYFILTQLCLFILGIIKLPVLTKVFMPESMGQYAIVVSILSYIEIIFFSWISSTFWRYVYDSSIIKNFNSLLSTILPIMFFFVVASFAIVYFITFYFYNHANYSILIVGYLSVISQQMVSFYFLYLQSKRKVKRWCLLLLIQQTASFLLLILFIYYLDIGIIGIFFSSACINTIFLFVLIWIYKSHIRFKYIKIDVLIYKKLLNYSYLILLINVFLTVLNNGDRFIIAYIKDSSTLGIYAQTYSIASVGFSSVIQAFMTIFLPSYNKSIIEKNEFSINTYIIQLYIILFTPVTMLLITFSKTITGLLLAQSYQGFFSVFAWVVVGVYFYGFSNFFEIRLKFLNKIKIVCITLLSVALLNIFLNYLLLYLYGVIVSAVITVLSYFLVLSVFLYFNKKFIQQLNIGNVIMHVVIANLFFIIIHFCMLCFINLFSWQLIIADTSFMIILNLLPVRKHFHVFKVCYKLIS